MTFTSLLLLSSGATVLGVTEYVIEMLDLNTNRSLVSDDISGINWNSTQVFPLSETRFIDCDVCEVFFFLFSVLEQIVFILLLCLHCFVLFLDTVSWHFLVFLQGLQDQKEKRAILAPWGPPEPPGWQDWEVSTTWITFLWAERYGSNSKYVCGHIQFKPLIALLA